MQKILLVIFVFSQFLQAQEWYVSSRHGECVVLEEAIKSLPYIKGAKTPLEIEEKLIQQDIKYTLKPIAKTNGEAFRFDVPTTEWAMLLVKKKFCKEFYSNLLSLSTSKRENP